MARSYPAPVDKLLTYGDPRDSQAWPNYVQLGLTQDHVPDLIQMALDRDLMWADSDALEVWAPVHAWRALGQLRAESAIQPLIGLWREQGKAEGLDDWLLDDLPKALALIGETAIPALMTYLNTPNNASYARIAA